MVFLEGGFTLKGRRRWWLLPVLGVICTLAQITTADGYSAPGMHWHNENTNWYYDSSLPSYMRTATDAGANTWTAGTPYFSFTKSSSSGNRVYWLDIDGPHGTLAYSWYYYWPTGHLYDANFKYDRAEKWNYSISRLPSSQEYDAWSVAAHEFGHWLVLNHSSVRSAVMYSSFNRGEYRRALDRDDKNGVAYIYANH